jgi:plastocyanin
VKLRACQIIRYLKRKPMKIVIGIVVVLGLGWLLFGAGAGDDVSTEPVADEEVMEGEAMMDDESGTHMAAGEKTFDLTGKDFEFSQTEIRVTEGDTVTVNFESTDGFHDFVVDEFDAATEQVLPGTPTSVTFVAGEVGEFEFYCSVGQHRAQGMVGTLIVEEIPNDTAMEEGDPIMEMEKGESMEEGDGVAEEEPAQ